MMWTDFIRTQKQFMHRIYTMYRIKVDTLINTS
jgi:hypothetical protein